MRAAFVIALAVGRRVAAQNRRIVAYEPGDLGAGVKSVAVAVNLCEINVKIELVSAVLKIIRERFVAFGSAHGFLYFELLRYPELHSAVYASLKRDIEVIYTVLLKLFGKPLYILKG